MTTAELTYQAYALGMHRKAQGAFVGEVVSAAFDHLKEMLIALLGLRAVVPQGAAPGAWTPLVHLIANPQMVEHVRNQATGGGSVSDEEMRKRALETKAKIESGAAVFPPELLDMIPAAERAQWAPLAGVAVEPVTVPETAPVSGDKDLLEFDPELWRNLARRTQGQKA